jgi:hypothetical protein
MRAVAVLDIANQFALGRIAPTTSSVRHHNIILSAGAPKRAPLVAMFQITMKEPSERSHPGSLGFLT